MNRIECNAVINRPVSEVYNQWTQFEEFPQFMESIKSVTQEGPTRLHWKAEIAGRELVWDAEIIDQVPDTRIVWRSVSGERHGGKVEFKVCDNNSTLLKLVMEYDPDGAAESIGAALGITDRQIKDDLARFKQFIESRPWPTGEWRGEIHRGEQTKSASGDSTSAGQGNRERLHAKQSGPAMTSQDMEFISKAAQGGLAEVMAGQLTAERASSPEVREFGQTMVIDHGKVNEELAKIAEGKGISLPASPDADHQALAKELAGLTGARFDLHYLQEAGLKDHHAAMELFSKEAKDGADAELKAFAQKTLPAIQKHHRMAQELIRNAIAGT